MKTNVKVTMYLDNTKFLFLDQENNFFDGKEFLPDLDLELRDENMNLEWAFEVLEYESSCELKIKILSKELFNELIFNQHQELPAKMNHQMDGLEDAMSLKILFDDVVKMQNNEIEDIFDCSVKPSSLDIHIYEFKQVSKTNIEAKARVEVFF